MLYTNFGNTDLTVSRICLGGLSFGRKSYRRWMLEGREATDAIAHAFDLGINFIDTADTYSFGESERIIGKSLHQMALDRREYVLATKCFFGASEAEAQAPPGLSRQAVIDACDASLHRLGTDYIDIFQIHKYDYSVNIEETIKALDYLVSCGKVRYVGACSMFAWQFSRYIYTARIMKMTEFVSMQNHYNLIYREEEREMVGLCRQEKVAMMPWSPLARGFLTGTRRRGEGDTTLRMTDDPMARRMYFSDQDFDILDQVLACAEAQWYAPAQISLAWLLSKPYVTAPILGISSKDQLDQAVAALDIELSNETISKIEAPYRPKYIHGHE